VLALQGNQPRLLAAATRAFAKNTSLATHTTWNQGHGREDRRTISAITVTPRHGDLHIFPQLNQILKIERPRYYHSIGRTETETAYALTNAARKQLSLPRAAEAIQDHWRIENNLHRQKDVRMREDNDLTRTRHAPHNLATLRNLALSIVHLVTKPASTARRWRIVKAQPWLALKKMGIEMG